MMRVQLSISEKRILCQQLLDKLTVLLTVGIYTTIFSVVLSILGFLDGQERIGVIMCITSILITLVVTYTYDTRCAVQMAYAALPPAQSQSPTYDLI